MKRLFQARSVCLLLAMLIGWSVASAQTIVPGILDTSGWQIRFTAFNADNYSQNDGVLEFTLTEPANIGFKIDDTESGIDGSNTDVTGTFSSVGVSKTYTSKPASWGCGYLTLPAGDFTVTAVRLNDYNPVYKITITRVAPKSYVNRYYYELDGVEVPMEDNGDGTYSVSLPEVVGSMSGTPDLPKTKLRLLEAKCVDNNGTAGKIVDRSYIYPSKVGDNRELKESAVAVGGSRDFDYAIADPTGKTNEEFVKYTTLLFQAARASYTITVNPATKKLTYFRKEYVPFPRRIYPNKPDDVQTALAFTRIPNDVSAEPYVRYTKGETVTFTVLKSLGLGKEYTYAPATDVVIDAGVTFTLVENGNGKATVGRTAKYRLAYSLDADNNIVVTVADTQDVIEALEVFLTTDDRWGNKGNYHRALQLDFDAATGHFVGSIYNENVYGITLRTDKADYRYYQNVNKNADNPYRDFVFAASKSQEGSWNDAPNDEGLFQQGHWYQIDAVERPDGNIDMRVVRVDADTVPDNAIVDDYYLVVTKADGSEVEVPMSYNGAYHVTYQTAAGEKYHFRGKTTSILDGKTYVVDQYLDAGKNGINKDAAGNMLMTHCGASTYYTMKFKDGQKKYIYATPVDITGKPAADGEYHKYNFNWYYFAYNLYSHMRRAFITDCALTVHPDPVLDVYTSTGKHGKLIYNHLRFKNEFALHLDKGEKVWVAELDADNNISHYWVNNVSGSEFASNEAENITLDGDQFDTDKYKVHTLYKSDKYDNAFVAPEAGDYYVAVSVNRVNPADKVIKFTKAGMPEKLYVIINDDITEIYGDNGGEWYARYAVEIPRSTVAGYYDTTNATLLKFDSALGEYVEIDDPSRLDAEGNLTLNNGERFYISDQLNIFSSNLIFSHADIARGAKGMLWGLTYGGYGSGRNEAVFTPGKQVRLYRGDMVFANSATQQIKLGQDGTQIPDDLFMTTTNEDGDIVYTDRHSFVFYLDLTSSTDPKYSWGEPMKYKGVEYALVGEYADEVTGKSNGSLPFVFHPQTGLYTLSLENFYGGMKILNASAPTDAAYWFDATKGYSDITDTSVPYPLYNGYDLDGNPNTLEQGGDNNGYFMITDPTNAIGAKASKVGAYGGRDTYVYKNVTLVFDPYSHRLFVDTRSNGQPVDKVTDPEKTEEYPMYMVFVRVRNDKDAIGDSYRSWRSWTQYELSKEDPRYADLFTASEEEAKLGEKILNAVEYEKLIAGKTDLEAAQTAENRFARLKPEVRRLVAEAKIKFFDSYLEIAGYRRMVPLRDNNRHYVTGEWNDAEDGRPGNGWIDTRYTDVKKGLNTYDETLPSQPGEHTLSTLSYPMYLADESLMGSYVAGGQVSLQSYFEKHNLIAYFFGEKEPVPGESLLEYMSKTVCYGCSEAHNKVIRLGRRFDNVASPDSPLGTEQGADGNYIVRIDRRSVGGRRATLFDLESELYNTEETPLSPNKFQISLDFRDPDDRISISNQIAYFNFFVMKIMRDSRFFAEFDNSTARIWSKVYRYDDKMYIVFNDMEDALAEATVIENGVKYAYAYDVYQHTQPRYVRMETVNKGESLNRIEAPAEDLPHNYVMKPVDRDEFLGNHQRDAYDKYAGEGFLRFTKNKTNNVNNNYSYFIVSRKTASDKGEEFNLHQIVTGTYNWLPLACDEGGNRNNTSLIQWTGDYGEKVNKNEVWKTLTKEAILSAPLQISRTGYLNFFSEAFLNTKQQVSSTGGSADKVAARTSFTKAPAYRAESEIEKGEVVLSEIGFIATESDAVDVIDSNVNDLYVESATKSDKDNSYVYRAHVVLKGGKTPVVKIIDATQPDGYQISYTGPVAENDMIYLERSQINHVYTGVEDITIDTSAEIPDFAAEVTVDGRRLIVTGASCISVYTVSGMALATEADSFDHTVDPGVYVIVADGATNKVMVK